MKNQSTMSGIIGGLIGGLVIWFLLTSVINSNNQGMMQMMGIRNTNITTQNGNMMNSNLDQHFIEQMIPHHEDAITMAKIAQDKAKKPEIKALANAIIGAQSKEINEMKQWYKDWYGTNVPQDEQVMGEHGMMGANGMHMGIMGDETDMTRLENADDFDKAFIEEMIPHHQMAVMMATMLKNGTRRQEMRQLANNVIKTQTDEINQMRNWYSQWYK